ncbi:AbrB/MazE/SpoVT family DNA-binding domain-containing protein [Carbonactinospora thermoautotrophica]|uniref:Transcriptional regulator n=1 Tax=Carbonactinospora thermoautotrophica TaxID=1469144 RepID=A0A132MWP7_9ACTN|nr:AbrB/MazE/SpoVT family DNA-binding domain-containing protein [Carbonactinospora thermoautotrophica]KWX02244.1 Transcriptional regulator [Carbonactinospora thermoautotrophica]
MTTRARARLRHKGQLTLPPEVRDALHIAEGDEVEFTITEEGEVLLRGMTSVPADQRWFWTAEWQDGEREASEQIAAGQGTRFDTEAAFLDHLEKLHAEADAEQDA